MAYHSVFYPDSPTKPMRRTGGEITRIPKRTSEDVTFGYLGCEAKGEYVRLVTSPVFIPAYIYYRKAQENVYFSNKKSAIVEAISWLHGKLEGVDYGGKGVRCYSSSAIPDSLNAARQKYSSSETTAIKFLGCLVYITEETLQNKGSRGNPLSAAEITARCTDLANEGIEVAEVDRNTNGVLWGMPLGLRPEYMEKYNEEPCERWNRIWHCLQHLDHYRGNAALLLSENAKLVDLEFQPRWWKKQPALSATDMLEAAMALIVPPSNYKERMCSLVLDLGDPKEDVDGWLDGMLEEPEYGDRAMEIRRP
jgi:hypothetical protein